MTTRFEDFNFAPEIMRAIREAGYEKCTPIQAKAMGPILEGHDLTGMAETGSGKTAAFLLPILQQMKLGGEDPRALVVAPTRELALQVATEARKLGHFRGARVVAAYGGTGLGSQKNELLAGVDLVVGTPGRLMDFIRQTYLRLSSIRYLVLDEADRMLDMGFIKDMEYIVSKAPMSRQTMLFSATLPDAILKLARQFMMEPVQVAVESPTLTARNIDQSVIFARRGEAKIRLLRDLLRREKPEQALVFVATREMTADLGTALRRMGCHVASISSLLSQVNRERVLNGFRDGTHRILVATDVAARGLDIPAVSHVFNFDLPGAPDDYVHRVGRTGRAGKCGRAISLVTPRDRPLLAALEAHLDMELRRESSDGTPLPKGPPSESGSKGTVGTAGQSRKKGRTRRPPGGGRTAQRRRPNRKSSGGRRR
ncbi:MAG: DEAD/DEAH box helicase [Acidobacteriota bacterium]